ncbi:MAG: hypothetical protein Q4D19_01505 [Lautropia sp.]|nr:hypothetical protein [Lautropia sp.]
MISRFFIIALFLLLPIVVALLSQRMASTVEPVVLPSSPIEVKLLPERKSSANRNARPAANDDSANDAPVRYTPRLIEHGNVDSVGPRVPRDAAKRSAPAQPQNNNNNQETAR